MFNSKINITRARFSSLVAQLTAFFAGYCFICIFLLQIEPKISARRLNDFHMTYGQVFNTPSPFLRRFLIVFLILELLGMKLIWGVQGKREF